MAPVLHLDPMRRAAGTIRPIPELRHPIRQARRNRSGPISPCSLVYTAAHSERG